MESCKNKILYTYCIICIGMVIACLLPLEFLPGAHASENDGRQKSENINAINSRNESENALTSLARQSDWNLLGHPAPLSGLLSLIQKSNEEMHGGWNTTLVIDTHAFQKTGINLNDTVVRDLHVSGVIRQSALRFILDVADMGFYVEESRIVVTTKRIAVSKWSSELNEPILQDLCDASLEKRRSCAFAAGYWRICAADWISPLSLALCDTDRNVAFDAAYALGELGPSAAVASCHLVNLMKSPDLTLREAAVVALAKVGPRAAPSLEALLESDDTQLVMAAAKSLGLMGSVASKSIDRLIEAARRHCDNNDSCDRIASSIGAIDLGNSVPKLQNLLSAQDANVRSFAADAIGEIGASAQSCGHSLVLLLSDPSDRVRVSVARALGMIHLPGDFSTLELESAAATDTNSQVRLLAKHAIYLIKKESQ